MPKAYTGIRDSLTRRGASPKQAKQVAARIYVSKGATKAARSARARRLQD